MREINFYPRPPRGGRPKCQYCQHIRDSISIHALRGEGDKNLTLTQLGTIIFLSTPSAGRATEQLDAEYQAAKKFLSTPSAGRATAKTEKNISAFVSL